MISHLSFSLVGVGVQNIKHVSDCFLANQKTILSSRQAAIANQNVTDSSCLQLLNVSVTTVQPQIQDVFQGTSKQK